MSDDKVTDDELAKILWEYNRLEMPLAQASLILALGSNDLRVAERAADLFLCRYAPMLLFSGGFGELTRDIFPKPEAEVFADVAIRMGVPREKILVENRSTNTGENIVYSRALVAEKEITPEVIILVQKPYMLRRAYATFRRQWPEIDVLVTGPQITYEDYPTGEISKNLFINIMVGDTQRIKIYPERGYQIFQEIPLEVMHAFEELVRRGYTKRLVV